MRSRQQGTRVARTCALLLGASMMLVAAGHVRAQAVTGLATVKVASGLPQPLFVTAPPGDTTRLFIVCQTGNVRVLDLTTSPPTLTATRFIDLSTISNPAFRGGGEQGLLGMAFDPNYASNGKFYLNFTVASAPTDTFQNGVTHVSQFTLSADPLHYHADPSTEKILITFQHPEANHNGGWIGFSPRANDANNLYIATGDGGNANDQDNNFGHIEPTGNAQNLTTLLGKMLRIHVDSAAGTASIPSGNPFVNTSGARGEIWAYGLRNPFRDSFDRLNGRMFIGDVGQNTREEVDVQQATNPGGGENYEWRLREGFISTPTIGNNPPVGGDRPANGVEPILDYDHSNPAVGQTMIGGYVYRGTQIPQLQGTYVFGDYAAAKIFTLNYDGTTASNFQTITSELFPTSGTLVSPSSFGEDANGELYITDIGGGTVYKIVPLNLKISSVTKQGGSFVINGTGVPLTHVTLQAASDPKPASFGFLASVAVAGEGTFSYTDATNLGARFYRVTYP